MIARRAFVAASRSRCWKLSSRDVPRAAIRSGEYRSRARGIPRLPRELLVARDGGESIPPAPRLRIRKCSPRWLLTGSVCESNVKTVASGSVGRSVLRDASARRATNLWLCAVRPVYYTNAAASVYLRRPPVARLNRAARLSCVTLD